jgi:hypothetical protein
MISYMNHTDILFIDFNIMIGRAGITTLKIWNKYLQEAGTDNEFTVINSAL